MNQSSSIISLIAEASLAVQLVMFALLLLSVFSWGMMYVKFGYIKQAELEARTFEGRFWSGLNLSDLYAQLNTRAEKRFGMEAVFENGFREFARAKKAGMGADSMVAAAHRSMRVSMSREIETLENNLGFLATVGSISPYIGLLGTVWGIMESFRALAGVQQATLAMVAPGISEALIATAMGLLAAIPAVIAYNKFVAEIDKIVMQYENFLEEFAGILQRQAHGSN